MEYSISTAKQLTEICEKYGKKIYEVMQEKEAYDFETDIKTVREKVSKNIEAMKNAIENGLKSKELSFGELCGDDCYKLRKGFKKRPALFGKLFEKVTTFALATSEENMRMNTIVACPTAGACATVPAVTEGISQEINASEEDKINALITAGTIGYIISAKTALAGAVAGCQAECGAAAAMAAGAAAQLLGGSVQEIINASALALKNLLGLTCDPVAGLVAIPCVKRNVFTAIHAITAAELSVNGVTSKIPFDDVIDALVQTGQLMSPLLKETSQGGLAITETGNKINKMIKDKTEN